MTRTESILIVEDEFIVAQDLQMILQKAGYHVAGIASSVNEAMQLLEQHEINLVMLDIYLKGKLTGIDLAAYLLKLHIPFIYISANSNEKALEAAKATQPYGFIVKPYRDTDILMSIDIARYRYQYNTGLKSAGELYLQTFIKELSEGSFSKEQKLTHLVSAFQPYIPFDFVLILNHSNTKENICITRKGFNEYQTIPLAQFIKTINKNFEPKRDYLELFKEGIFTGKELFGTKQGTDLKTLIADHFFQKSNLIKTIDLKNGKAITFCFFSQINGLYKQEHNELLDYLDKIPCGFDSFLNQKLASTENIPVITPRAELAFDKLTGKSTALLKIMDQIKVVAPTDTSVLIMGESGTGKENVAINLHRFSQRSHRPMVTVNCAALPQDLIESILFGHEKGAFTGATESRTGKFEEANGGTLFLDEIGEMPLDLQSKLLRVLQEKEIEKIGSSKPTSVDIRIIAATNRDLEKEIAAGKFRLDLYYRLYVFPINIPPLRERRDDIAALTAYFINIYSQKLGKNIKEISESLLQEYCNYDWPGNIRELEHMIERSVLLCQNDVLEENLLLSEDEQQAHLPYHITMVKTIAQNERDHIVAVLKTCDGRISGSGGAAELLGIPSTTLSSKMKKFGIKR